MKSSQHDLPPLPPDVQELLSGSTRALQERVATTALTDGMQERVLARVLSSLPPAAAATTSTVTTTTTATVGAKLGAVGLAPVVAFVAGLSLGVGGVLLIERDAPPVRSPDAVVHEVAPVAPQTLDAGAVVEEANESHDKALEPVALPDLPLPRIITRGLTRNPTTRSTTETKAAEPRRESAPDAGATPTVPAADEKTDEQKVVEEIKPLAAAPQAPVMEEARRDSPEERMILESARAALAKGDGGSALSALERHRTQFPRGSLVEEREALTVLALVASGRRADAVEAGRAFRVRFPSSLLIPAVDTALAMPADPHAQTP